MNAEFDEHNIKIEFRIHANTLILNNLLSQEKQYCLTPTYMLVF